MSLGAASQHWSRSCPDSKNPWAGQCSGTTVTSKTSSWNTCETTLARSTRMQCSSTSRSGRICSCRIRRLAMQRLLQWSKVSTWWIGRISWRLVLTLRWVVRGTNSQGVRNRDCLLGVHCLNLSWSCCCLMKLLLHLTTRLKNWYKIPYSRTKKNWNSLALSLPTDSKVSRSLTKFKLWAEVNWLREAHTMNSWP